MRGGNQNKIEFSEKMENLANQRRNCKNTFENGKLNKGNNPPLRKK
jgi:hypothetical protein